VLTASKNAWQSSEVLACVSCMQESVLATATNLHKALRKEQANCLIIIPYAYTATSVSLPASHAYCERHKIMLSRIAHLGDLPFSE